MRSPSDFLAVMPPRSPASRRTVPPRPGANAQIVIARLNPSGTVLDVRRLEIDGDAVATRVEGLEFSHAWGEPPVLFVSYDGAYGTADWVGEVGWHALLEVEISTLVARAPAMFSKSRLSGAAAGGGIGRAADRRGDPFGLRGPHRATDLLWSFEPRDGFLRMRHFVRTLGSAGLTSGWSLMPQL